MPVGGKKSLHTEAKAISFRLSASGLFRLDAVGFISKSSITVISGRWPLSPLVPSGTTFAPLGSMSLDFRVALLPYKSSSFATPLLGRATKGKRLYGQARRLTSPDLHILCRMCTVGLWILCNVPHVSTGKHRANLPLRGRRRRQATEGVHFHHPSGRLACFPRAKPGCMVFFPLLP